MVSPTHLHLHHIPVSVKPKQKTTANHTHAANAVSDLYLDFDSGLPLPSFTTVADNITGYMQYLDLVRDCISVFGLEPLPANDIRTAHQLSGNTTMLHHGEYAMEDARHHCDAWSVSTLDD
jgi:hypothetical protein